MEARGLDVTQVLDLPVHKGDVFAGRYEVDRVLGSGGMGMVVRAKHVKLDEMVAIKFLLPGACSLERVTRFEREARAVAKIKGDHVAKVLDLGSLESGAPYIVMEYLDGEDLDQRLRRCGRLPVAEAIDFVTQVCEAMAEAHTLGIIHRDLKSSNLFVVRLPDGSERVKVLDFGIAKMEGPVVAEESKTRTMAVMGSPTYMSPEQLRATRDVDARTDIWALGVILYELLTGTVPFDGDGLPELYIAIANAAPPPMRRASVPDELEDVIFRCLAKSRDDRYRDVAELAHALAAFGPPSARASAERTRKIVEAAKMRSPRGRDALGARHHLGVAVLAAAAALAVFGTARSCGETQAPSDVPAARAP
jgi:serine/threonine-protein kinase